MDEEIKIDGGESLGDDFYEKIEAPKFVDLTAPDHYRPDNEDRYWFCLRVGCDQKHEEEMDSEAIYKNFVLRVMAARSPNVRLRKALYGKDSSTSVKCPLTVPAKSSKSRISRLALVSSISQKMVDGKVKGRPLFKQCETPKKQENQSSVAAKALTTPQNKKRLSNLGTFRSVRNPKPTALAVPKNKMVAKTLVFHSPKKTVRVNLKKSVELSASMRKLCAGMKKLEITSEKKHASGCNKPLPVDASRKRFRGREVKSRVYDSLHPQNCKAKEAKSSKCLKKKNEEKELQLHCGPAPYAGTEIDYSDMEIEEKSRACSLELCSTSGISRNNEVNENEGFLETQKTEEFPLGENKGKAVADTSRSDSTSLMHGKERNTGETTIDQLVESSPEKEIKPDVIETDENENASVSDDKENESDAMNHDDKENTSASHDKRKVDSNINHMKKKKILGNETSKCSRMVMMQDTKGMTKTSKGNSTTAVNCAEGVHYKKPKLTNPKPFRLRTDERQILKEANLEKKLHLEPLQETKTKRIHQNAVQKNEKCLEQTEYASDAHEDGEKESARRTQKDQPWRRGTSCLQTSKTAGERKETTTLRRNNVSMQRKTKLAASEFSQDKAANQSEESLKKNRSLCIKQQVARTQGIEPSKRKTISLATPGRLGVIKESSPTIPRTKVVVRPMENGASPASKASAASTLRPSLLGRKPATIPKEPHFHNVHVPKSCTRRAT
ncbi:Neurofilament heavy protein [Melia azedarach]|uniref:Neurofilament heavy protein n=1 Tax=Melia azedarach TaxID=155640 RepID=A0ACC1XX92_MELAZ|nr:Neurofilament heavy protein [Melia azedarach]